MTSKNGGHRRWRTTAEKQERSRQLRQEQTTAESLLWQQLRNRKLEGLKFRRQHPLDRFIVDFCCSERRLIVELDGAVHQQQHEYDQIRTDILCGLGYTVVRFTNDQVEHELPAVLETLRDWARNC